MAMAKPRRNANVKLLGVVRRRRSALLVSTALCATVTMVVSLPAAAAPPAPNAQPTGGVVVGGSASISQGTNQTTINQSTQRAAIDWQTFNVGSQQSVQFNQPSSRSVTLNEVVGPNPSQIAGKIDANGQIIIENQSGVIFYKGSQVNTAGLMVTAATSSDAATHAFINGGQLALDQAANPNAQVVNQGQITIKQAGLAALVAPQVANSGVITAKLGTVVLAGGATKATLDLYGDGMLSIDVTGQVVQAPNGALALVTNSGLIVADGGTVRLTARVADGLVQTLVNAGGKIQANSVGSQTGTVTLNGVGGSITVVGQLDAEGTAPGTTGGAIAVNATGNVTVASGAKINASGQAGGGLVAIGTTLKRAAGGPGVTSAHTAAKVTVAAGATIAANATGNGNGGRVTVLSTGSTEMDGLISATGGPLGGNGGFVETSGHVLDVATTATVDVGALAAGGTMGTWLLDPYDITIAGTNQNTGSITLGGTTTFSASGDPGTISAATLDSALGSDNVVVTTSGAGTIDTGNITVAAAVNWSSTNSLQLLADNNITVNAAITGTSGSLTLTSGKTTNTGTITVAAPISVNTFSATAGSSGAINLNVGTAAAVTTAGGGQTFSSPVTLQAATSLSATGGGTIHFASTVDGANTLIVNAGTAGVVNFGSTVGAATPLSSLTVTGTTTLGGNVSTDGAQTYNSAVTLAAASVTLNSNFNGTSNGAVHFVSTVDATTAGAQGLTVTSGSGLVTFGGAVGSTKSLASLGGTGGTIALDGNATVAGALDLTSTGSAVALAIDTVLNGGTIGLVSGGTIAEGAGGTLIAGTLTGSSSGNATFGNTNTVGTLGNFAATAGNFDLVNSGSIAVTGSVSAANATINAGTIGINNGSIVTPGTGSVTLASTAGAIALTGTALLNTGTVSLASHTGIAQSNTSTIDGTLFSATASSGAIVLLGTANNIGTVTGLTAVGGGITVVAGPTMVLTGTNAGTDLFFEVAAPANTGTLQIGGTTPATLIANGTTSPTISLVADNITEVGAGNTIVANSGSISGTLEIAPYHSAIPVSLGGTSAGTLSVGQTLLNIVNVGTNGLLRIGAYTGTVVTAGNISIDASLNVGTVAPTLELDSTSGSITEAGSIALTVGTLTGTAATGGVSLASTSNAVGTLASFGSGGNFFLNNGTALTVAGTVTAAGTSTLGLTAGGSVATGNLVIGTAGTAGVLHAGTVSLTAPGTISEAVNQGTIIATVLNGPTVTGSSSSAAAVNLLGSANAIGTLGLFASSGTFHLENGVSLAVVGPVSAQAVSITNMAAMVVSGTIGSCGTLGDTVLTTTAGSMTVQTGALIFALDGNVALTAANGFSQTGGIINAPNVGITAVAGDVSQSGGTIAAVQTITVTADAGGFTQSAGVIAADGSITVTGADSFALSGGTIISAGSILLGTNGGLTVSGAEEVAANGDLVIGGSASTLLVPTNTGTDVVQTGGLLSSGATLTILSGGNLEATGGNRYGGSLNVNSQGTTEIGLVGGAATIATGGSNTIDCGGICTVGTVGGFFPGTTVPGPNPGQTPDPGPLGTGAINILGAAIIINTLEDGTTVFLDAHGLGTIVGNINEVAGGTIVAITLSGSAENGGSVSLGNGSTINNYVSNLASFQSDGGFRFTNAQSLNVTGVVQAGLTIAGSELFIEEAAGQALTFVNGGSVIVSNGTIGLVADVLTVGTSGAIINAGTNGTVELAPRSTLTAVSLDGTAGFSGLLIGTNELDAVTAAELRIGGYHDATNSGSNVVSASTIDIGGPVTVTPAEAPRLRLDANGPVTETSGTVSVGTLTVGTLVGTASSYTLTNANNNIGTLGATIASGTLTATSGSILVRNATSLAVGGVVSALASGQNIFLEEATGQTLSFVNGGSVVVSNGTIGLVADTLTVAASNVAISTAGSSVGTVEIAPITPGTVSLAGTTGLALSSTALGDITASLLRIGGYHDQINSGTNVVSATSNDISGTVILAGSAVPTLRLDSVGQITEGTTADPGGPLSVGTLSASTNGATGDINLGTAPNTIAVLGNMTAAKGNVIVQDHASAAQGTLAVPASSIIYGNNVSIANWGSVVLAGSIGACTPGGSLGVTAFAGDIIVNSPAVIGAQGTATFSAANNFTQNGGLINASDMVIGAGSAVTQNGGIIAALDTTLSDIGVGISAGAAFSQAAGAAITSNSGFSLTASSISVSGNLIGVGSGTLNTTGPVTQGGGTVAAGQNLSLLDTSSVTQTAGTLSAGGILTIDSSGPFNESGSARMAGDTVIPAVNGGTFVAPIGSLPVLLGGTLVYCICAGAETIGSPGTFSTGSPPTSPIPQPPATYPYHIDLTEPTIPITSVWEANWVELHSTGDTTESGGGMVVADLLTGSASNPGANVQLGNANQVGHLGSYAVGGNFTLKDPATALTVIGTVSVGNGFTLALTAPTLTVDHTGTIYTVPSGTVPLSTTPDGSAIVHTDTFAMAGLLVAPGSITISDVVTPGQILLQTDNLTLSPGIGSAEAPGGIVVFAPDGMVAIAPQTAATISLDGTAASTSGTLSLSQTLVSAISTIGTVGTSGGTAGTETLVLGSLDGSTPLVGTIDINTGIALAGVARNLVLDATGPVQETAGGSLSVISLAGSAETSPIVVSGTTLATGFALTNGNTIAELGNVGTRIIGGTTWTTAGTVVPGLLNLVSGGDVRVTDNTGTLAAVGAVVADAATLFQTSTIALTAPTIAIINGGATLSTGTIVSNGSLLATAGTISSGTLTPSLIQLQADSLSIANNSGSNVIVSAPSGQVAIAPLTQGRSISIDGTATLGGTTLSLGITDLALIDTLSGPLLSANPGPVGTQTLSLGSLSNGATVTAGTIAVNAFLQLGSSGGNQAANTLALYSNGGVIENAGGSIAVNTLTGTVTNGSIYLNGNNQFSNLGNLGTLGGITTPGGTNANLLALSGNILIHNTVSLDVVTNVQGSSGVANYAEIDVLGPTNGNLTVLNGGTAQAGNVYLRAGNSVTAGSITVNAFGTVLALAATGEADLAAGVQYTAATPTTSPSSSYGPGFSTGSIAISGSIIGGTVGLFAADNIDEPGFISAGLLTGFSDTGHAFLIGSSGSLVKTDNLVANLGTFSTAAGFVLRDDQALAVVGPVSDSGVSSGVTIAVAPTGTGAGGFGVADLVIASSVSAASTVKLEATGNVYETGAGTIANSGGTFAVTGGIVTAATLVSQAGVIPDTESGGNTPGTIPASTATFGRAIDWFGDVNQAGTLGNVTATGNFLLHNGASLTVPGTVIAGTLPLSVGTIAPAYPVVAGPFGTTPASTPAPFAEIDVIGGNLTIPGTVHVGLDGTLTGNVTLRAGNSTTAGAVTIAGDVFAADGGTVSVSAGFDPTISPPTGSYFAACGSIACDITISGTIWGDETGASPALASILTLNAASSIDETGAIGATMLTGGALGHAVLLGGGEPTLNRVVILGTFDTNGGGYNDPEGLQLRDGQALLVAGPVTDHGTTSSLVSIAVAPPGSGPYGYGVADLVLASAVSANPSIGTVKLQATGNVYETGAGTISAGGGTLAVTGGTVVAGTLVSQAGVIPDTETGVSGLNSPGTIPATGSAVSQAIDFFGDVNHVGTLGNVTATGNFLLNNGQALTVVGTVMAGAALPTGLAVAGTSYAVPAGEFGTTPTSTPAPFAEIDVLYAGTPAGNLTIATGGIVHAGLDGSLTGNVTLRAGNSTTAGSITIDDGGVYAANGGTVSVSAGFDPTISPPTSAYFAACGSIACDITINGTIWGDLGAPHGLASVVTLDAASSIDETPSSAMTGATTLTGFAGGHVNLSETTFGTLAGGASANQIGTLASFISNGFTDDPQGFILRDGAGTLTVTGPVTNGGTAASDGISIAVVPGSGTVYTAGNLVLDGNISAATTTGAVVLQATGNIIQSGGSISALTLGAEAGLVPGTETSASGSQPGTIAGSVILSTGSIVLTDSNQIGTIGTITGIGAIAGMSAEGDIKFTNVPSLVVNGTIVSQNGTIVITDTGDVTNKKIINSISQDVTILAADITNNGTVVAENNVFLNADNTLFPGGTITNNGLVEAVTEDATLIAGFDITNNNNSTILAGYHVFGESGTVTASDGSIFDNANALIQANGAGSVSQPSVRLTALNGGSISEASLGVITATNAAGVIELNASSSITVAGSITAFGTAGLVGLTAGDSITQTSGSIIAGGPGGTLAPSISLVAQTGTIGQAGTALIAATSAGAGDVQITASNALTGSITVAGTITALGTAGVVGLTAGNSITQGSGSIIAGGPGGTLAPSVSLLAQTGTIDLAATGTILATSAAGSVSIVSDGTTTADNIYLNGMVSAPTIDITALFGEISLGNGTLVTGGVLNGGMRPTGTILPKNLPPNGITTQGAYLTASNVIQTPGSFTVQNLPGTIESVLSITLKPNSSSSTLQFSSGGLDAPHTWLILNVGIGQASGRIDVEALDFGYILPPGKADFTNSTINGFTGDAAAAAAFIEPQPNANFRVDGCPIHSVNCVLLATQGVPTTNPANDINLGAPLNTQNPEDLVLPVVSDERYELVPCDDPNAPRDECPAVPQPPHH